MKTYEATALHQNASVAVTVTDYEKMIEQAATLEVTVEDYTLCAAQSAVGTVTIVSNDRLEGTQTSVTVGTDVLVLDTDFALGADEDATATNLAAAIDALSDYSATATGSVVTITVVAAGTAGNSLALSTTGEDYQIRRTAFAGGTAAVTVSVDGNDLVAGTDFTAATSEAATATSLASAINSISGLSASAVGAVITVTVDTAGYAGNAKVAATTNSEAVSVGGSTFSGGQDNAEITIDSTTLVQGTDFTASTDNDTTATALAAAINGVTGIAATAAAAVITAYVEAVGTAGNSIVSTLGTNTEGVTVSAATFTGGVAATYTEKRRTLEAENLEAALYVTAKSGTNPTLDVTPQYSFDGDTWFDMDAALCFDQIVGTVTPPVSQTLDLTTVGSWFRFKIVEGGTNPAWTFKIFSCVK